MIKKTGIDTNCANKFLTKVKGLIIEFQKRVKSVKNGLHESTEQNYKIKWGNRVDRRKGYPYSELTYRCKPKGRKRL